MKFLEGHYHKRCRSSITYKSDGTENSPALQEAVSCHRKAIFFPRLFFIFYPHFFLVYGGFGGEDVWGGVLNWDLGVFGGQTSHDYTWR